MTTDNQKKYEEAAIRFFPGGDDASSDKRDGFLIGASFAEKEAQVQLSNYAYQMDLAKRERDEAMDKLDVHAEPNSKTEAMTATTELQKQIADRDATIKQLQEENQRLKEALKMILPIAEDGLLVDLNYKGKEDQILNARKLLEP